MLVFVFHKSEYEIMVPNIFSSETNLMFFIVKFLPGCELVCFFPETYYHCLGFLIVYKHILVFCPSIYLVYIRGCTYITSSVEGGGSFVKI